jgi:hypothetical protein
LVQQSALVGLQQLLATIGKPARIMTKIGKELQVNENATPSLPTPTKEQVRSLPLAAGSTVISLARLESDSRAKAKAMFPAS